MQSDRHMRWVVRTPDGWLGQRRFTYGQGTFANGSAKLSAARIFSRKQDAVAACRDDAGWEVRQVEITLV